METDSQLYYTWGKKLPQIDALILNQAELLSHIQNVYNSGKKWQRDGTPEQVAHRIWTYGRHLLED